MHKLIYFMLIQQIRMESYETQGFTLELSKAMFSRLLNQTTDIRHKKRRRRIVHFRSISVFESV